MKIDMKAVTSLVIFMLVIFSTNSAFSSCSKDENKVVTGAACSISELNQLERMDNQLENPRVINSKERSLRPLRFQSEFSNIDKKGCLWGYCLSKKIFGR